MNSKSFFYVMIGVIVLGFMVIFTSFYWGSQQLDSKAKEISELQTDRDFAREQIIALKKASLSTSNKEEATKVLDILLPTTKSQDILLADIFYTASQEASIPLENISTLTFNTGSDPSDLSGTVAFKDVPGVLSYPFTMVINDINYGTLIKMLSEIEQNGRLVQVDDIQITPNSEVAGEISSVSLTMKAFLKP